MIRSVSVSLRLCLLACLLAVTALASPIILMGSDYLQTTAGTTFAGFPFVGVPVGPGNTDTIVRRTADPGTPSLGMMTIHMASLDDPSPGVPEGTFDSFFDVFFEIRLDTLHGPLASTGQLQLSSQGTPWDANPSPFDLLVNGLVGNAAANWHTNKGAGQLDFFPGPISESHPSGAVHNVTLTSIPEPGTLGLMLAGLVALGARFTRRRLERPATRPIGSSLRSTPGIAS